MHPIVSSTAESDKTMQKCCIHNMAVKGIKEKFKLATVGERWTCPICGRVYEMWDVWREVTDDGLADRKPN